MRLLSSLCLFVVSLTSLVVAKSAVGDRLLVVLEDESQKGLYSKFWADLEGAHAGVSFGLTCLADCRVLQPANSS